MAIVKCEKGHFYDDVKYKGCPHCSELLPESGEESKTVALSAAAIAKADASVVREHMNALIQEEKTVSLQPGESGIDPVVGWLVCVEGPEKGRDYRVHSGRNFIGRSLRMDISIADDPAITRENHCSVVYDPQSGNFFLVAGTGTNTYLDGERLTAPARLEEGEIIRIGDSKFCFVAYCKGEVRWL